MKVYDLKFKSLSNWEATRARVQQIILYSCLKRYKKTVLRILASIHVWAPAMIPAATDFGSLVWPQVISNSTL